MKNYIKERFFFENRFLFLSVLMTCTGMYTSHGNSQMQEDANNHKSKVSHKNQIVPYETFKERFCTYRSFHKQSAVDNESLEKIYADLQGLDLLEVLRVVTASKELNDLIGRVDKAFDEYVKKRSLSHKCDSKAIKKFKELDDEINTSLKIRYSFDKKFYIMQDLIIRELGISKEYIKDFKEAYVELGLVGCFELLIEIEETLKAFEVLNLDSMSSWEIILAANKKIMTSKESFPEYRKAVVQAVDLLQKLYQKGKLPYQKAEKNAALLASASSSVTAAAATAAANLALKTK